MYVILIRGKWVCLVPGPLWLGGGYAWHIPRKYTPGRYTPKRYTPRKVTPEAKPLVLISSGGNRNRRQSFLLQCVGWCFCNVLAKFKAHFYNDFYATISDMNTFINTFRAEFCDEARISCSRLIRPKDHTDAYPVISKTGSYFKAGFHIPCTF